VQGLATDREIGDAPCLARSVEAEQASRARRSQNLGIALDLLAVPIIGEGRLTYRTEDDEEWVVRIVLKAPIVDRAVLLNSTFGLQMRTDGTVITRPFSMEMEAWAEATKKGSFQDETIDELVMKTIELDRNETDAETVPDLRLLRDRLRKALAAVDAEISRRGA
jgi:hypothetical protein